MQAGWQMSIGGGKQTGWLLCRGRTPVGWKMFRGRNQTGCLYWIGESSSKGGSCVVK